MKMQIKLILLDKLNKMIIMNWNNIKMNKKKKNKTLKPINRNFSSSNNNNNYKILNKLILKMK
jgi:hypothetical protein